MEHKIKQIQKEQAKALEEHVIKKMGLFKHLPKFILKRIFTLEELPPDYTFIDGKYTATASVIVRRFWKIIRD